MAKQTHRHKPVYPYDVASNVAAAAAYASVVHGAFLKLQPQVVKQVRAALDKKRPAEKMLIVPAALVGHPFGDEAHGHICGKPSDPDCRARCGGPHRCSQCRAEWQWRYNAAYPNKPPMGIGAFKHADLLALSKHKHLLAGALAKADDDDKEDDPLLYMADAVARGLDISALDVLVDGTEKLGASVVANSGRIALAQFGWASNSDIVNRIDPRAVEWARMRAAELVGMRYDENGLLVEAARTSMGIDDATRNMIRSIIYNGLRNGDRNTEIADALTGIGPYPFSEERARVVAHTEIARAHSQGSLSGYKLAVENGVKLKKLWSVNDSPCTVCETNGDQGAIPLDDVFDSGDDAPPGHPFCECGLVPVVANDDDGEKAARIFYNSLDANTREFFDSIRKV